MIEAEREYNIAQALPNRTRVEVEDMPADELDAILSIREVYENVFHREPNKRPRYE